MMPLKSLSRFLILGLLQLTACGGQGAGHRAMVASTHPLASQAGVEILRQGGNAVDAAVAVGFALAVVYPRAGNIGGGGFMVLRTPSGELAAVDYREKAPLAATPTMYQDETGNVIPGLSRTGHLAVGVPGSVAGLALAHREYGRLSWLRLLQPAIRLAREGFVVDSLLARSLAEHQENLADDPGTVEIFFRDQRPLQAGEQLVQADLAWALRQIAEKGPDAFYRGEIADFLVAEMERGGGLITRDDLARYQAKLRKPLSFSYRGYKIHTMPPPSSGGVTLALILNQLAPFPLGEWGHNTPRTVHYLVEAMRRAYADRGAHLGDPDFVEIPLEALLSPEYAAFLRKTIDPNRASVSEGIETLVPAFEPVETTHYSIVDEAGMAVSTTTTLNLSYGANVLVDGAGFFLNDEMDDFSAKPGTPDVYGLVTSEPNAIAPEKRMLSSMTPTIVTREGRLVMVLGTPGGGTIITSVAQVLMNVMDHGMSLPDAVAAGRIHHQWLPDVIRYEAGALDPETISPLDAMGHSLEPRHQWGDVQAILVDPAGRLHGVADPRRGGAATGY